MPRSLGPYRQRFAAWMILSAVVAQTFGPASFPIARADDPPAATPMERPKGPLSFCLIRQIIGFKLREEWAGIKLLTRGKIQEIRRDISRHGIIMGLALRSAEPRGHEPWFTEHPTVDTAAWLEGHGVELTVDQKIRLLGVDTFMQLPAGLYWGTWNLVFRMPVRAVIETPLEWYNRVVEAVLPANWGERAERRAEIEARTRLPKDHEDYLSPEVVERHRSQYGLTTQRFPVRFIHDGLVIILVSAIGNALTQTVIDKQDKNKLLERIQWDYRFRSIKARMALPESDPKHLTEAQALEEACLLLVGFKSYFKFPELLKEAGVTGASADELAMTLRSDPFTAPLLTQYDWWTSGEAKKLRRFVFPADAPAAPTQEQRDKLFAITVTKLQYYGKIEAWFKVPPDTSDLARDATSRELHDRFFNLPFVQEILRMRDERKISQNRALGALQEYSEWIHHFQSLEVLGATQLVEHEDTRTGKKSYGPEPLTITEKERQIRANLVAGR